MLFLKYSFKNINFRGCLFYDYYFLKDLVLGCRTLHAALGNKKSKYGCVGWVLHNHLTPQPAVVLRIVTKQYDNNS